ncbi:MAG: hypothetical protein ACTHNN_00885 [Xanthobacteraceae bacterium]
MMFDPSDIRAIARKLLSADRWFIPVAIAGFAVVAIFLVVGWRRIQAVETKAAHRSDLTDLRIDGLNRRLDAMRTDQLQKAAETKPAAVSDTRRGRQRDVSGNLDALTPIDMRKGTAILLTIDPLNKQAVFKK